MMGKLACADRERWCWQAEMCNETALNIRDPHYTA